MFSAADHANWLETLARTRFSNVDSEFHQVPPNGEAIGERLLLISDFIKRGGGQQMLRLQAGSEQGELPVTAVLGVALRELSLLRELLAQSEGQVERWRSGFFRRQEDVQEMKELRARVRELEGDDDV